MLKKTLISISVLFFLNSGSDGKAHRKSYEISPTRNVKLKASLRKKTKKVSYQSIQSTKRIKKQRIINQPTLEALKRLEQKRIQKEVVAAQQRQQQSETVRRAQEFKYHEFLVKNHTTHHSLFQDIDLMELFKFGSYGHHKATEMIEAGFYHTLNFLSGKRAFKATRDER